jgi:hypothetical protein
MDRQENVIVLGAGYVARFILTVKRFDVNVLYTSRDPEHHLRWVPPQQRLLFDLDQPDTWPNIPSGADLLWCFPAAPLTLVQQFASGLNARSRRIVVLGSTSAYDVSDRQDCPPPWIDETAPVDISKPRVQGEEYLRRECGAVVLRVAGIYGCGRHPYQWIRAGRVALSDKYVNLIHAEDVAGICLAALQCGLSGTVYNVSDGVPRTWRDIGRRLYGDRVDHQPVEAQGPLGKRIRTARLRSLLEEARTSIRHPDLFRALEDLPDEGQDSLPPATH